MAFLDSHPGLGFPAVAGLGLLVGSFLNVVILRLPRRLEWEWKRDAREILEEPELYDPPPPGIVVERSHCPHCNHQLSWYENIPLLSWMALGGKCRGCKAPGARAALSRMVTLLGDGSAVLTHCFAGKDRTGFGVAVLLDAGGVDHATIMADYLRSNSAIPQLRAQIMELIANRFDDGMPAEAVEFTESRLSDDVLGVHEEYLDAALKTVREDYGSVQGYLSAAGVAGDDITRLRAALLE